MKRNGHILEILLAAVLLFGLLPVTTWAAGETDGREATVLFTHDLHSCFQPRLQEDGEERGGFARLAAALEGARGEHPNALTVDAGDFSSGSLVQTLSTTRAPELLTLGAMGYDAVTAGNHEFDNGSAGFSAMLTAGRRSSGPLPALVMANYRPSAENADQLDLQRSMAAYGVQECLLVERGGVTYGIFGLMGQDAHASAPTSGFSLEDPAQAARRCVERLEEQGAELIICLSHSGTSQTASSEDEELAQAVPGIDLIVSGHTHTTLEEPLVVGETYIVSAGANCENLGSITLSWNEAGEKTLEEYRLIPIDDTVGEDPAIAAMTADWKEQVDISYLGPYGLTYDQVLTRSDFFLPLPQAGVQEGNALGELTADAFRWAAEHVAGLSGEVPVIALTADGVLRAPLPRGNITTAQVFDVLNVGSGADGTAGSPLISCYLTGKELRAVLEVDATVSTLMPEAQLYLSGVVYSFNTHRMLFNKVTEAQLYQIDTWSERAPVLSNNGAQVNDEMGYTVAHADRTVVDIENNQLYPVVTSLYCGQMLQTVKDRSFGLLSIVPKDENGEPVSDLESRILYDSSGREVKEWYALAAYLQSFGQDGIPTSYAWPDGRKDVSSSWNPIELIKSPSLLTIGVLLLAAVLVAAVVLLVRAMVRRKRSGRYGGYRRRRFFK